MSPVLVARRSPRGWLGSLALALTLLLPQAAQSASFTSVTGAFGVGNSTNLLVDTNPPPVTRVRTRNLAVSNTVNSFQSRYSMLVGTDIGNNPSITENFTANYTITLSILGAPGENWQVIVATGRVGALTVVNDGNGSANATLGAVTGSAAGGSLTGSLGLAAVGTASNAGAPTTNVNTPFNQTSNALVTGVGTGAVQVVTLSFSWTASTTSTRQGNNGDEAAVRMGETTGANSYSAGDYADMGDRVQALDGHFVSATLIPEPETAFLLASGLLGLAWSSRRRA